MRYVLLVLLISVSAWAVTPCQNLTICQDQIAARQAQQNLYDAQAQAYIAGIQAQIAAMPSPSPNPSGN